MKIQRLHPEDYESLKKLFLDVFSKEPWNDKWEDEQQLDLYLSDLIDNKNSLPLILYGDDGQLIGGSLGYIFHWWEGKEYFIKEFFISADKQNQGLGSFFLRILNDYLKDEDVQNIWLATEKDVPAYQFYLKNNFSELKNSVFFTKQV